MISAPPRPMPEPAAVTMATRSLRIIEFLPNARAARSCAAAGICAPNSMISENTMIAVPMALISGVTPRRIEEKT